MFSPFHLCVNLRKGNEIAYLKWVSLLLLFLQRSGCVALPSGSLRWAHRSRDGWVFLFRLVGWGRSYVL